MNTDTLFKVLKSNLFVSALSIRSNIALTAVFFFTINLLSLSSFALSPYEIEYEAEIEGYDITAVRKLEKLGDEQYRISQTASTFLMNVSEASDFSIENQQLITQNYSYQRNIIAHNKSYQVDFSDHAKKALYRDDNETQNIQSNTALFSLITYQTEIRRRLLGANANNSALHFDLVDKDKKRFYSFSVKGEEKLKTTLGEINCIKIERIDNKRKKKTEIWLAIDYEYSLIAIKHFKNNELKYRLDINKGNIAGKAIKGK
jgi:hypothetical protein